ncbi:MAG: Ig-like domain-containing protein, partial [Prevotellaceae bacterium]|nr:Ig-like domain-containing protein [Prevotellaceae bacterium]
MKKIIFLRTMLAATVMLLAGMNLRGDNVVYTFSVLGSNNISNPSGDINSSVSFTTQKNQSSTDPAYNGTAGEIRLYYHSGGDGGSITLTPKNGAVITEVKITATTTPVVKYNVDGGADATANLSGTTYTISGISVSSGLKIRNANTSNNTQFRFTSIEITYTASSCNDADLQFGVSSVRKLDTDAGFTETATSVAGSTGTVTYESTNTGVATVNANTGEVTITGAGTTQIKAAIAAAGSFCADEASYDLKVYPGANAKTYELVTSDAGLADDAKYLIVGIKGAEYYALGWQKASNRHAIEIPVVNDEVTIGVAATVSATQDEVYPYEITLKSHASEFMLYDALNAGYLRPNTGGSTGLYTKPQEAYWTINFGTGANLECTGSEDGANFESYVFMRFNATNNPPLFNCYGNATGQTDVYLYRETAATPPTDTDPPVLTFDPANNATDVAVTAAITITSNEPLRKADGSELTDGDLTPALVVLKETNSGGTDVPFTATIDAEKKVITVTPSSSLSNSQVYYVAINSVADTAGNLTTLQSVTFTTEAGT